MPFAQGSRSVLAYIKETSFGVLPATPVLQRVPFKTHSLSLTKERLQGQDILGDRLPTVDRHGNRQAGGSIEVDLRAEVYDDFLEAALFGEFTSDVLKVGVDPSFLFLEDGALDIAQYRKFSGMGVSQMSISMAPNQMIQTTFEMVGQDMAQESTTESSSAALAASLIEPFDSYNGLIYDGGTASGDAIGVVSALNFSVQNSLAPTFVIGSDTTPQLEFGLAVVEGTMTVYYEDATLIDKFLNEDQSSIRVVVDDPTGTNAMTFDFPRVKYNGATVPVANPQSRFIEIPFVALKDSTAESNLVITRS